MNGLISRRCWLGLLGLVWLGVNATGQAWERPPLKIHTQFQFKIEVKTQPQIPPPTAPWYAYFPADPRLMPRPQTSPYPPWPMQFPPQGQPFDVQKNSQNPPAPAAPMVTQVWPGYYSAAPHLQPVGFVSAQAPSYWYQGR